MKRLATLLAALSIFSIASGASSAPAPAPAAAPVPPPPLEVTLEPVGAVGGIINRADLSPEALAKSPVTLRFTVKSNDPAATSAEVSLTAEDMFSKPVDWKQQISVPLQNGEGRQDISFKAPSPGYFLVHAAVHVGGDTAIWTCDFGLVPPSYPGVRPDSFFASNSGFTDSILELFQAIGMKVARAGFLSVKNLGMQNGLAPGQVPPLDFTTADQAWANIKAHGVWLQPLTGSTLSGGATDACQLAQETGMFGPPADYERYANAYAAITKHYPEIRTIEFYNEPWFYGYTFAGTPADYDRLLKLTGEALHKANPNVRLIAGSSSMFVVDNIEPYPSCYQGGILDGICSHPYVDTGDASFRAGDIVREMDETRLVAQRMGLPYAYLTEGGTEYPGPGSPEALKMKAAMYAIHPELQAIDQQMSANNQQRRALAKAGVRTPEVIASTRESGKQRKSLMDEIAKYPSIQNNIQNAAKIVQYYAKAAIIGLFQGNVQTDIGYGYRWTCSNVTFAVMTHFIEDRPPVADIWPANELIWGGIFANPKFVTPEVKALPRANEISARWNVAIPKERQNDKTKVAIIWSATGQSNDNLDTKGTLTIPKVDGLTAYDMTGREIPAGKDGLTVPFGNAPVYITSDTLSVIEMRDRIAHGILKNVTPVNLYALSLFDDPTQPQKLSVRVENQINVPVNGTLRLKVAGATEETSAPFSIEAAKLAEVAVPWPKGVTPNENNQYNITLSAEVVPAGDATVSALPITVNRQQIASVARFVKKTIPLTGTVDDWKGVTPVILDSNLLNQGIDLSAYYLNPSLGQPTGDATAPRSVTRVYTAYDKDNVYLAAAVNEDAFGNSAGEPAVKGSKTTGPKVTLPYKIGMPGGLDYPTFGGDCFQFSFGFRDRVPGQGRQMDDPYAWKGDFYDVDYDYLAHPSTEGDQLIRVWGPNTSRQNGYQMVLPPGQGPVPNARIKITRNETTKLTLYEMAIPRSELNLFNPATGRCRFGFIVYNGKSAGVKKPAFRGGLNWSDAAGVFDYWHNVGSFPPTWSPHTPCETFFGIEK